MRLSIKIRIAKIKLFIEKLYKQAQKIALAVVIAEALMVGSYAIACNYGLLELLQPKTIYIELAKASQEAPKMPAVEEVKPKPSTIEQLADLIWTRESTKGKNNYSKCEAIGKINGIGYGIPGNGMYQCFTSHAEEMQTLEAWINKHIEEGLTEKELLCHYSGSNYKECK